jgi:hypothetical protein
VLQRTQGCRKGQVVSGLIIYKRWERLSIKKGYKVMLGHGVSKHRSAFEAIKGVRVYSVGSIKK